MTIFELLNKGNKLYKKGRLEEALKFYDRVIFFSANTILSTSPDAGTALYSALSSKGEILIKVGKVVEGLEVLKQSIKENPFLNETQKELELSDLEKNSTIQAFDMIQNKGDFENGIKILYNHHAAGFQDDWATFFVKGKAHNALAQWENALDCYLTAEELSHGTQLLVKTNLEIAKARVKGISMKENWWGDSNRVFLPNFGDPKEVSKEYNEKGVKIQLFGEFKEALNNYNKALEYDPENADAKRNQIRAQKIINDQFIKFSKNGMILLNQGKHEEALGQFQEAYRLNNTNSELLTNIGITHLNLDNFAEALKFFNLSLEQNSKEKATLLNKGIALSFLARFEESIECFRIILNLYPRDPEALSYVYNIQKHRNLYTTDLHKDSLQMLKHALSLVFQTKYDEAKKLIMDIIESYPQNAESYLLMGICEVEQKNPSEALSLFDKALELQPNNADTWNHKGWAYDNLGEFEEAIECYNKAINFNPNISSAWNNKGLAFTALEKHEDAIRCFDKSLEINPDYSGAWFNKGESLKKIDKPSKAYTAYLKALELNPNLKVAQERLDELNKDSKLIKKGTNNITVIKELVCPKCGEINDASYRFCEKCGKKLKTPKK